MTEEKYQPTEEDHRYAVETMTDWQKKATEAREKILELEKGHTIENIELMTMGSSINAIKTVIDGHPVEVTEPGLVVISDSKFGGMGNGTDEESRARRAKGQQLFKRLMDLREARREEGYLAEKAKLDSFASIFDRIVD